MVIKLKDTGQAIEAVNEIDLVHKMRNVALEHCEDNSAYMKVYARRAVLMSGEDIRSTSEKEFISDLIRLHHIELV